MVHVVLAVGSVAAAAAAAGPAGSAELPRVVVVDSWYTGDFAEGQCKTWKSAACAAAIGGPKAESRRFEDQVMTQFAVNHQCKGIVVARYYGLSREHSAATNDALNNDHGMLMIDYVVGNTAQSWSLVFSPTTARDGPPIVMDGENATPAKIAADVCAIVMGHGGTLVQ
jgi:hypothetical protein